MAAARSRSRRAADRESISSMSDFMVKRDDLRESRIDESEVPELEPGQTLLRVDSFGLTANNITYAALGQLMSYWDFFPAEDGWGRIPMWGFADVERSRAEDVEPGVRVYGYLPPSSYLVVTPAGGGRDGFVDASPQRAALPPTYQRYLATDADPFYEADTEDLQMLLRPLFFTSFLIDDQLFDDGLTARGPVVFSSASSKTAIGAAYLLSQRDEVELVGLTSSRNVEFVEGLEVYDRAVAYDAVESLERSPATFVDVAGDAEVRLAIHTHYGDELIRSVIVGRTHWEQVDTGAEKLPGPSLTVFFAPDRATKRSEDWGRAALQSRVSDAWHPFCAWAGGRLEVIHDSGFEALQRVYLDVLEGRVGPESANVLSIADRASEGR
jgi:Protein of unknown function (DUF2855)